MCSEIDIHGVLTSNSKITWMDLSLASQMQRTVGNRKNVHIVKEATLNTCRTMNDCSQLPVQGKKIAAMTVQGE